MEDIIFTANQYRERYEIVGRAHYIAWEVAAKKNKWLGIPVVVTTTIVGAAIFGTIQEAPSVTWRIIAGMLSLLAALLSALQTLLRYSELAEKHKSAGCKYHDIRRDLDSFVLKYSNSKNVNRNVVLDELERIKKRISDLAEDSPSIPDKIYEQAAREIKCEGKKLVSLPCDKNA